jgi:hypothetical protein
MSKVTELASGAITATDYLVIELIEADETPAAVIVRWPLKPTVLHIRKGSHHSRHRCSALRRCGCQVGSDSTRPATVTETSPFARADRAIQDLRRLPLIGPPKRRYGAAVRPLTCTA